MKTLCLLLAAVFSLVTAQASTLQLSGALTWEIFEPNATFTLNGSVQNLSPGTTGTLKLVLWATKNPYPSTGYPVAELNVGEIPSGYELHDFTARVQSKIPTISGAYYFTISILEYTGTGWATRLVVPGAGIKNLSVGDFTDQPKWKLPKTAVIAPPKKLKFGNIINLTPKATGDLYPLPLLYRVPARVTIRVKDKVELLATENEKGTYRYAIKKGPFNNKRVASGNIALDYKGKVGPFEATEGGLALYYQSATGGTYKLTEFDKYGKFVTYGTFTFVE